MSGVCSGNLTLEDMGVLLLAGGEGRRMGREKAGLTLGGRRFLDRLAEELSPCAQGMVSVRRAGQVPLPPGFEAVEDRFPPCGPLGGLYAGLTACRRDFLLAVPCDVPLFPRGLAEYLACFAWGCFDAVVPVDRGGRVHPLCGVYARGAAGPVRRRLEAGDFRVSAALEDLRTKYVPLAHSAWPDSVLRNVNTPADYRALTAGKPPVLAVCGRKNAGKTTFLCGLLPQLRAAGVKTAVIKHDGHDFQPDVPGTDSFRLRLAGAERVAVYSSRRFLLTGETALTPDRLAGAMGEVDLILLEGDKDGPYPRLEVIRAAVSREPVSRPEGLLALCTDLDAPPRAVPRVGLEDYAAAVALILREVLGRE